MLAASAWLANRNLIPKDPRWHVEIVLEAVGQPDSRFHLEVYAEEWGFKFCHAGRVSWIRVTDVPFGQSPHMEKHVFLIPAAKVLAVHPPKNPNSIILCKIK